ncbi:hypothetical protein LEP1GSC193_3010 [Leptospira alstonii serovar Pingchang str. 80-412]|uniref:Uncharacterized protein n=2 Tax=Leptospira alstonii TaxID=28452 RepID=M6CX50_9LEPT|nr:hypothetical protein LEP1GSC194_1188 [Leptospira alstonii serovar Sichuan str. 79601]EQA81750.1 hypothetical protein LEP1GSC193_3010 [Leptospira alstonii serovar Pingchang str. 80-412]
MEIPKELERKARSRAIFALKFASDSPKFFYAELTLSYRKRADLNSDDSSDSL